jgi:hypothetical protein
MQNFKQLFFFLFFFVILAELIFGYWFKENPLYLIKTPYKDYKYFKKNIYENQQKKVVNKYNIYGMRYDNNNISNLDGIFFGSGIMLQSQISDGKTFVDLLENKKDIKLANFGADGQSTSGHIHTLELLKKYTILNSKYYIFLLGMNEGSKNENYKNRTYTTWNFKSNFINLIIKNSFFFKKIYETQVNLKNLVLNFSHFFIEKKKVHEINNEFKEYSNFINTEITKEKYNYVKNLLIKQNYYTNKNMEKIFEIVKKEFKSKLIFLTLPNSNFYWKNNELYIYNKTFDFDNELPLEKKIFYEFNYLRGKIISDQIMKKCEILESICINGFDKLKLNPHDFNDQFHLNEIGSEKVFNFLNLNFKNVSF